VRKGALTDARGPSLRLLEWSLPEDAEITDPNVAKTVNPASWITPEGLKEQSEAVPELAYRRFHCGQWTEREGPWLPAGAWQACVGEPELTPGEDVWIGVDVGGERSASAVIWINERLHVGVEIYHGDQGVHDCVDKVRELAGAATLPSGGAKLERRQRYSDSSTALMPEPGFDSHDQSSSRRIRPSGRIEIVVEHRPLEVSPLTFSWL
jgi:hypothetical protein